MKKTTNAPVKNAKNKNVKNVKNAPVKKTEKKIRIPKLLGKEFKTTEKDVVKALQAHLKSGNVGERGSRGIIVSINGKKKFAGLTNVIRAMGMNPATFGSAGENNTNPTLAKGGKKNVCIGDMERVMKANGIVIHNTRKNPLPRGIDMFFVQEEK